MNKPEEIATLVHSKIDPESCQVPCESCAIIADAIRTDREEATALLHTADRLYSNYALVAYPVSGFDPGKWISDVRNYLRFQSYPTQHPQTEFQLRVALWMIACFGPEVSKDRVERNYRFLEEALELVQANGCTEDEAHQLVGYVFSRPIGDPYQECGGVMITLSALCLASGIDIAKAAEEELVRVWGKIDVIRAKQANKPHNSPLPESRPSPSQQPQAKEEHVRGCICLRCEAHPQEER